MPGKSGAISDNTFGKLVRAYRKERGWSQQDLADKWGFDRTYVAHIETGKRHINQVEQVQRLAEILEIPVERLAAAGKHVPQDLIQPPEHLEDADDFLLQTLLEPAQATVKLSWLVWHANHYPSIVDDLTSLTVRLEDAITNRRGAYLKPAQSILAYAHEMLGKITFDKLDYTAANGHFQVMLEMGEEMRDSELTALALIHMGDVQRRRGRYEQSVQVLESAQKHTTGNNYTSGLRWMILARTTAEYGRKQAFLKAIDNAEAAVNTMEPSLDAANNEFNMVGVLQEKAQGHTLLGEPKVALEIYRESNRIQPFRPMRELGVFAILQAQAHAYAGDLDTGVEFAIQGLRLARGYQSQRHVSRVQRMYDRLQGTTKADHPRVRELGEALRA